MDCRYGNLIANPYNFRQIIILGRVKSAGKLCMGIIISTNGGASWTEARIRDEASSQSSTAAVDPRNAKVIYVAGRTAAYKSVVYKSVNGGAAWTEITNGIDAWEIQSIAVDPGDSNILYCAGSSLWRSADGGASWADINPSWHEAHAIAINKLNPNEVFVGSARGLYYSQDRGLTWTDISEGITVPLVNRLYFDPTSRILYAGTRGSGIWTRNI